MVVVVLVVVVVVVVVVVIVVVEAVVVTVVVFVVVVVEDVLLRKSNGSLSIDSPGSSHEIPGSFLAVLFLMQYDKQDRRFSRYLGLYIRYYCCKCEYLGQIS